MLTQQRLGGERDGISVLSYASGVKSLSVNWGCSVSAHLARHMCRPFRAGASLGTTMWTRVRAIPGLGAIVGGRLVETALDVCT
jgi:hypothetical protein